MGPQRLLTLPPHYGDPFYRGRGRGRGRGNGERREWLQGRPIEGSNGDVGRENGRDRRTQPLTSTNGSQPVRQDDEWLVPPAIERSDDAERRQVTQTSPSAAPPPMEERLFTDWSSKNSPRERANQ